MFNFDGSNLTPPPDCPMVDHLKVMSTFCVPIAVLTILFGDLFVGMDGPVPVLRVLPHPYLHSGDSVHSVRQVTRRCNVIFCMKMSNAI